MDVTKLFSKNTDLIIYLVLCAVAYGIVSYWKKKNLEALEKKLAAGSVPPKGPDAPPPPDAEKEAAQARLSALTGMDDDPAPAPDAAAAAAPAEAGGVQAPSAPEVSGKDQAVLTQYTAGDGQGVEEIVKMLEKDPNNLQLLDWLAFMYYSNNETDKAIETYSKITQIDPSNASQHYYLANSYYKANRIDEALQHWRTVMELKPDGKLGKKAGDRIKKVEAALGG